MSIGILTIMKKKSRSSASQYFRRKINLRQWSDFDRLKAGSQYLQQSFYKYFVPEKHKNNETFEAAKKRLKLTEKDLLTRQNGLLRVSRLMFLFACGLFIYALIRAYLGHLSSMFVSLMVSALALTMAFRYHFWYFQIKHRKLGCSLREWFQQGIRGEKK